MKVTRRPETVGPTLSRRASLNAMAAAVDYGVRILIQVLLAPLMLRYLGAGGYGSWQVLQRLVGQATPAGGRPGEALKWMVAHEQESDDHARKRRQVGTAVAVWALFLPLVLAIGGVLAWVSPALVDASGDEAWAVRVAAGLLVLNLVLLGVASLPQSVLQGENLGYRRLGISTAILVLGAILMVVSLRSGWGLVGLAATTLVATALSGLTFLQIVRRHIVWWGIARPARGAVRGFIGLSWWFLLWNLVMQAIKGSDLIVLAALAGTSVVATYALTSLVPHAITDLVFLVISSTMPGLGGIVGSGDLQRAARLRAETLSLCWLLAAAGGATTIVWLPTFLHHWVGSRYDAGTPATVLICLMVLQLALIRVDANVIDLTLTIRTKVLLGVVSAVLSIAAAVALLHYAGLGIPGLVAGFIAGRLLLSVAYPVLVARLLEQPRPVSVLPVLRAALASAAMFGAAVWLQPRDPAAGWTELIGYGCLTGCLFLVLAYVGGLDARQRGRLLTRVRRVLGRA